MAINFRKALISVPRVLALLGIVAGAVAGVGTPPPASAEVSLYAGAGPRFSSASTTAVGSIRGAFGLGSFLAISLQVDGYLTGAGGESTSSGMAFAGGQLGLMAELPIPFPIKPEVGVGLGVISLTSGRHGVDDTIATFNGEFALRGSLGPLRLRASYTHIFWSADAAKSDQVMGSQLMFQAGFGF